MKSYPFARRTYKYITRKKRQDPRFCVRKHRNGQLPNRRSSTCHLSSIEPLDPRKPPRYCRYKTHTRTKGERGEGGDEEKERERETPLKLKSRAKRCVIEIHEYLRNNNSSLSRYGEPPSDRVGRGRRRRRRGEGGHDGAAVYLCGLRNMFSGI